MTKFKLEFVPILLVLILNKSAICETLQNSFLRILDPRLQKLKVTFEDSLFTTDELISKYGYPVETHFVTTEDGYILQLHRIPRPGGKPFLLQHGLLDSSATFVITGPKVAPAYYLWDEGYDVWLGNSRGNTYSRNHTSLDPNERPFWDFSFHEMGTYDMPAMIDYILEVTNHPKLTYVGHSQAISYFTAPYKCNNVVGTTVFFVMCIRRPEYNEKVTVMHALAPVAFINHMYSTMRPISLFYLSTPLSYYFYELLPSIKTYQHLYEQEIELAWLETIFTEISSDYRTFDVTMLPMTIPWHFPAGTSTKGLRHFMQMVKSARFCEFDFGRDGNFAHYGQIEPPEYDLSKVRVPIGLYNSYADTQSVSADVERLASELGSNVVTRLTIPGLWLHVDFVWAIDIREIVYDKILTVTNEVMENSSSELGDK